MAAMATRPAEPGPTSRRSFLAGGAASVGLALAGCSGDGGGGDDAGDADRASGDGTGAGAGTGSSGTAPAAATTLTAADFAGLAPCRLAPEQTEGPFYADLGLVRRDITEGMPGHPLRLGVQVVDEACAPVPGATVDVWHADAGGDYSAFADGSDDDAAEGTTFLRGSQVTDSAGIVEFATVYPGWYPGRAVHIHAKVHLGGGTVLTTQLYFPEDVTDEVQSAAPYDDRGTRDTRNEDDAIAGDPAVVGNLLAAVPAGAGTQGLVVLGIDPGAG
jgi:protocatechuate 3,4-dioxygenase beta subunit